MVDPGFLDKGDNNLLIYYYFTETPTSGVAIQNQADNAPANTDIDWHSSWGGNGIPGINGLYGIDLNTAQEDGVDPAIPPQWGVRNMYAASGHVVVGVGAPSYYHKWWNKDGWSANAIGQALSTGDFSFGGWFKSADNIPSTENVLVNFASVDDNITDSFRLKYLRSSDTYQFVKRINFGDLAFVDSTAISGGTPLQHGHWQYWNHIIVTVSGSSPGGANIFLNGEWVAEKTDTDFSTDFVGGGEIKYLALGATVADSPLAGYQGTFAWRDFFFFDKVLNYDEAQYIFNNDISKASIFKSTNNNLLLYYNYIEPSGTPLRSWATNTPTGMLYEVEEALPLDTDLQWYNNPENGYAGIESIDISNSGHISQGFGADNPSDEICASGNTTTLYHALRGADIHNSEIADVLASGSFSTACWFTYGSSTNAARSYVFSFDQGSADNLCLGFNTNSTSTALFRFIFNDGVGDNNYLYNNIQAGNQWVWNHVVITHANGGSDGKYGRFYINGILGGDTSNPELDALFPPTYLTFFNNHDDWIDRQFRGAIKDFALFNKELDADEISSLYLNGITLVTSEASGIVGGYIPGRSRTSGIVGGYGDGWAYEASGIHGGYIAGRTRTSGIEGGYIYGANRTSGIAGGFIYSSGIASGICGGYTYSVQRVSGIEGGYIHSVVRQSGVVGGFINSGLQGSGIFDSWFRVKGLTYSDFDSQIEIRSASISDFDAQVSVYIPERPPFVSIKYPDGLGLEQGTDVSGVLAPLTIWFVASGLAIDGKSINRTTYDFGDLSARVNGIPSGVDEYATTYYYTTSGIYIATFRATDSGGLTGSDSVKIHLASGVPMPDVELSATPQEGNAPLSVDFSYSITNIPAGVTVTSKILYLGNGQSTVNPNTTYIYGNAGSYVPVLVVKDSRGFITCDSLYVGVNN